MDNIDEIFSKFNIRLSDYADGCKGHYCITRDMPKNPVFCEHWSENSRKWTGFGTLYESKIEAFKSAIKLGLLST